MPSFGPDRILANDLTLMLSPFPRDDPISLKRGGCQRGDTVPSVFSNVSVPGIDRKTSRWGLP
jgi:hypothetical protein